MASTIIISFVFFALIGYASAAVSTTTENTVNVTVYFESYCPDSIKFLTKQLYPTYITQLKDRLSINLVPYGKATKSDAGVISCHHGEKECVGNKVIACALKNGSLSFADVFKFVNCTSSIIATASNTTTYPTEKCVDGTPISAKDMEACANGPNGEQYLEEYGDFTAALTPPLSGVPTVVFNGKFDTKENSDAISNFKSSLCKIISGASPECVKNSAGMLQFSILSLIITFTVVATV